MKKIGDFETNLENIDEIIFLFEKENNKDYNVMEVLNFWRRYEKNRRF